jgi:AcrR family transcriptional regulator
MLTKKNLTPKTKDHTANILKASLEIFRQDGWEALTMRKIAKLIHFSAPVIYDYFENKAAINTALTSIGFSILNKMMLDAKGLDNTSPEKQLEQMWMAYVDFAQKEKQLYGLMFSVGNPFSLGKNSLKELKQMEAMVMNVIDQLHLNCSMSSIKRAALFHLQWAFVHGLSSLILTMTKFPEALKRQLLAENINRLTAC